MDTSVGSYLVVGRLEISLCPSYKVRYKAKPKNMGFGWVCLLKSLWPFLLIYLIDV